jgi:hypothetical protein
VGFKDTSLKAKTPTPIENTSQLQNNSAPTWPSMFPTDHEQRMSGDLVGSTHLLETTLPKEVLKMTR